MGDWDLDAFEAELDEVLSANHAAFRVKYKDELNELAGLSRAEIDSIVPGTTDLEIYDDLMTVVRKASSGNLAQAELKKQITRLGDVAVTIAKKVPSLAVLFA
jgi:hypothetical protein